MGRLSRAVREPILAIREVNAILNSVGSEEDYNEEGVDVFAEEWDNLLLLDSCRVDTFAKAIEARDFEGSMETRTSRGADTREFMRGNLRGRDLHDVVYVNANPQYTSQKANLDVEFHDVADLWRGDYWDDDLNTVRPEPVSNAARAFAEEYPNKRLFVHYLQPHRPFIGPTGRENPNLGTLFGAEDVAKPDVPREVYVRAYRENLDLVLDSVEELLGDLDGKTVVSADHGQLLGERLAPIPVRDYGHWGGIHMDELVEVPWFVVPGETCREIVAERPVEREDEDSDVNVEERLKRLGYM